MKAIIVDLDRCNGEALIVNLRVKMSTVMPIGAVRHGPQPQSGKFGVRVDQKSADGSLLCAFLTSRSFLRNVR